MTQDAKIELVKKLKSMVIFQKSCLDSGNWGDYDHAENEIKKLENEIVFSESEKV